MIIRDIKINGLKNPLGLDETAPILTWTIAGDDRKEEKAENIYQASVKLDIIEADSKKTACSLELAHYKEQRVRLSMEDVRPKTRYDIYMEAILSNGEKAVGEAAFETGFLNEAWEAAWIGPDRDKRENVDKEALLASMNPFNENAKKPKDSLDDLYPVVYFVKKVHTEKKVKAARIYASARGVYELRLNGTKVGDMELAPEFSTYDSFIQYQTYDVTDTFTSQQDHDLQVLLGDGYYIGRIGMIGVGYEYGDRISVLVQLELIYEDGTKQIIGTDDSWLYGDTDIVYSDIFIGEKHDFTAQWTAAEKVPVILNEDMTVLKGQLAEPLGVTETIRAKEILITPKGETVIDFGQVICGITELTLTGSNGDVVVLEHQETLDENGNFFFNIPRFNCEMQDTYVLDGICHTIRPLFTIHGFRYVRVSGYSGQLRAEDCKALVIGSDLERTGEFRCSDERLNQLQKNIYRSQASNFVSVPTDCPQRERAGWTGDIQIYGPTASYNAGVLTFLKRWLYELRMDQLQDGEVPVVVPYTPGYQRMQHAIGADTSAGWGDVVVYLPWTLYKCYGDTEVLEDNFEAMEKWMAYVAHEASKLPENAESMTEKQKNHYRYLWQDGFHFGDWLYPSAVDENGNSDAFLSAETTKKSVAAIMYALSAKTMIDICAAIGNNERRDHYADLYDKIREAYGEECVDADGRVEQELQGVYTLALAAGLIPQDLKAKAVEHLVDMIDNAGGVMDAGFLSIPYFLEVLYENGHQELAWNLLFSEKYPSWLYEVKHGATSVWESWDAIREDGKPNETSFNHYAFGCVGDFMYRHILGIQVEEPGYRTFRVMPDFTCGLTHAEGKLNTLYGTISVSWYYNGDEPAVEVEVPINATARLRIDHEKKQIDQVLGSGYYRF